MSAVAPNAVTARIANRFKSLAADNRAGLATFVTAGDPDPDTFAMLLAGLPAAGADIIEIGMPFSDPMADGPAIQLANMRALDNGMTLQKTIAAVHAFRKDDSLTPIVLMGYYNPIYQYGVARFLDDAVDAGVDGLIIVDLPPEEDDELCHPALTAGISWIRLVTPTTNDKRLSVVLNNASGFVYYVAVAGVTGTRSAASADIENAIARLRQHTDLPIAVGFGVRTPEQVGAVAKVADAVAVGSAIVNTIASTLAADPNAKGTMVVKPTLDFVAQLASGIEPRG